MASPGPVGDLDVHSVVATRRHRAVEFRKFLDTIEAEVPADLDVHLIADNYATHKTAADARWDRNET